MLSNKEATKGSVANFLSHTGTFNINPTVCIVLGTGNHSYQFWEWCQTSRNAKSQCQPQDNFASRISWQEQPQTYYVNSLLHTDVPRFSLFFSFFVYKTAFIHSPRDKFSVFLHLRMSWVCLQFLKDIFIWHRIWGCSFFQHLKNITPLPSNLCGFR